MVGILLIFGFLLFYEKKGSCYYYRAEVRFSSDFIGVSGIFC